MSVEELLKKANWCDTHGDFTHILCPDGDWLHRDDVQKLLEQAQSEATEEAQEQSILIMRDVKAIYEKEIAAWKEKAEKASEKVAREIFTELEKPIAKDEESIIGFANVECIHACECGYCEAYAKLREKYLPEKKVD